jgi:hypothetical protein
LFVLDRGRLVHARPRHFVLSSGVHLPSHLHLRPSLVKISFYTYLQVGTHARTTAYPYITIALYASVCTTTSTPRNHNIAPLSSPQLVWRREISNNNKQLQLFYFTHLTTAPRHHEEGCSPVSRLPKLPTRYAHSFPPWFPVFSSIRAAET